MYTHTAEFNFPPPRQHRSPPEVTTYSAVRTVVPSTCMQREVVVG
jgi:hypothetical protein